MSFLSLFAIDELIHRFFLRCLVTTFVKTYGWENVRSGKCRRQECPFREVSIGEVSYWENIRRGTVLRESVSLGSVHEEVSVGELYGYQFINETFSEELLYRALNRAMTSSFRREPVKSLFSLSKTTDLQFVKE